MYYSDKFKTILGKKYLSHIHTSYSDGVNSVEEYCAWADSKKLDAVVFSEHVRRELSYDFTDYIKDIDTARRLFPSMEIWRGVETKFLPDGTLDIHEEILPYCDVLFFACHAFPDNVNLYKTTLSKVFRDEKWKNHSRVWAHPGFYFKTRNVVNSDEILAELILLARNEGIFIEKNILHNVPSRDILSLLDHTQIIIGYDSHSISSLRLLYDYS